MISLPTFAKSHYLSVFWLDMSTLQSKINSRQPVENTSLPEDSSSMVEKFSLFSVFYSFNTKAMVGIIFHRLLKCSYQSTTFPILPRSRLAVSTPSALNVLTIVLNVMLFPLSILDICASCTPIRSPSCFCVRFC